MPESLQNGQSDDVFFDPVGYNAEREPDFQYHELLKEIMEHGQEQETRLQITDEETGKDRNAIAKYIDAYTMRFDLRNGFPMLTERNLAKASQGALAEIIAFMNGAQTLEELDEYGVPRIWWEPQITPEKTTKRGLKEGELGPGSYGPAYHDFPTESGKPHNQMAAILAQMRENPELRTHAITSLIPQHIVRAEGYDQKVVVVPCHGSFLHFRINNGEVTLKHLQRSGDVPVGVQFNMVQYAALTIMFAQATGNRPKEYIHIISDAHIYENQFKDVERMLENAPRPFPRMLVREDVANDQTGHPDIFAYRKEDFRVEDYDPYPYFRIGTAR